MVEFEVFVGLKIVKSQTRHRNTGLKFRVHVRDEDKGWKPSHNLDKMTRQKHTAQVVRSAKDQNHGEFQHLKKARDKVKGEGGMGGAGAGRKTG